MSWTFDDAPAAEVEASTATLDDPFRLSRGMEEEDVVVDRAGLLVWARRAARVLDAAGGAFSSALRVGIRRVCW